MLNRSLIAHTLPTKCYSPVHISSFECTFQYVRWSGTLTEVNHLKTPSKIFQQFVLELQIVSKFAMSHHSFEILTLVLRDLKIYRFVVGKMFCEFMLMFLCTYFCCF